MVTYSLDDKASIMAMCFMMEYSARRACMKDPDTGAEMLKAAHNILDIVDRALKE